VMDDGIATGATMIAALKAVLAKKPEKLICATPVAAADSLQSVADYADQVVCLHAPENFMAVGQFYRDFPQVSDDAVRQELAAANASHP
ncbi:MAG: phosphoribosyltransferase family protein, partial [Oxalobacteraceae bacterium]